MALFDVSAFRMSPAQLAEHVLADALTRGEILEYEAKLAQRWVIEFLTEKNSMPFANNRGCSFVTRLRSGRVRTEHDLFTAFAASNVDLSRNLRGEESSTDDARERYAGSKLLGLKLGATDGLAELNVQITSRANTRVNLELPINVKL